MQKNRFMRAAAPIVGMVLLSGVSTASFADAVATAYLGISNFKFSYDTDPGAGITVGDKVSAADVASAEGFNNYGDVFARQNDQVENSSSSIVPAPGFDINAQCAGSDCGYVNNSFVYKTSPDLAGAGHYAVGDSVLTGAMVDPASGTAPDVTAKSLSEVSLAGPTNDGTVQGNIGNSGTFEFGGVGTIDFVLTFDAEYYLRSIVTADEEGVLAAAATTLIVNIRQQGVSTPVFSAIPGALNATLSSVPGQEFFDSGSDSYQYGFTLQRGVEYSISVRQATYADATLVPEPGSLALLGAGLLAFGFFRKRTQKS